MYLEGAGRYGMEGLGECDLVPNQPSRRDGKKREEKGRKGKERRDGRKREKKEREGKTERCKVTSISLSLSLPFSIYLQPSRSLSLHLPLSLTCLFSSGSSSFVVPPIAAA